MALSYPLEEPQGSGFDFRSTRSKQEEFLCIGSEIRDFSTRSVFLPFWSSFFAIFRVVRLLLENHYR